MNFYDIHYRLRKMKRAEVFIKTVACKNVESAWCIAKATIEPEYTIIKVVKSN